MTEYDLHVRAYECDAVGHVNNAVYVQYLEEATCAALGLQVAGAGWEPAALAVAYHAPAYYGDQLRIGTWPIEAGMGRLVMGYRIDRLASGEQVVEAQITWRCPPGACGETVTPPQLAQTTLAAMAPGSLRPFVEPPDNGSRPFLWRFGVRHYEVGVGDRVGPAVYLQWLDAATLHATTLAGWTLARIRAADFLTVQYRHDARFFASATHDSEIEIISRLIDVRRVRGTWLHEIRLADSGATLIRDYSTGAFTTWGAKIRNALPEMMADLVRGQ